MGSSHLQHGQSTGAGLCDLCGFQRLVVSGRGSTFSLCRRALEDARYDRYPRTPVLACPGYRPRGSCEDEAGAGSSPSDG